MNTHEENILSLYFWNLQYPDTAIKHKVYKYINYKSYGFRIETLQRFQSYNLWTLH